MPAPDWLPLAAALTEKGQKMKIELTLLELLDLQTALRRAERWTKNSLEMLPAEHYPSSREVLMSNLQDFSALHEKLEAAFDERYPPDQAA